MSSAEEKLGLVGEFKRLGSGSVLATCGTTGGFLIVNSLLINYESIINY